MNDIVVEAEPQIAIIGPEGVPLRFPRATIGERGIAFCLDLVLLYLTAVVVLIFVGLAGAMMMMMSVVGLGIVLAFVIQHGYFIMFESLWQGATPGKRLMNLKVISRDGAGLTTEAVIGRNLMRDVELFIPLSMVAAPEQVLGDAPWWMLLPTMLWLAVMFLMPLLSKENTRVGDLVGGTLVVRVPKAELIADEAARVSLPPYAPDAGTLLFTLKQLDFYGEKELETLAELIRKTETGKASLHDLQVVAITIAKKIGFTDVVPHQEPERFLRAFYKQQRGHLEKKLLFGKRKASKHE